MKFRVERDDLANAVTWAARALPTRPSIPTLSGLLLHAEDSALSISGFDMENASKAAVDAAVDEAGSTLVSGRLLADISKSLPAKPVVFTLEGNRVEVQCGRSSFVLPTLPVNEYPQLPEMPDPVGSLSGANFAHAVAQAAVAAGRDDTLPMLLGVRVEIDDNKVTLAATDRYRLAVREFTWTPLNPGFTGNALVPARVLADAAKQLVQADEVRIAYAPETSGEGLMGFEGEGRTTTTRLLDGEFPKYRQLLPDQTDTLATVSTAELVEAVKRVSLVAERNTPVKLNFTDGEVSLRAGSGDEAQASESVECKIDGEPIEIAFNPAYLLDGLGAVATEEVNIAFTNSTRPAVLTPTTNTPADNYQYLLMPVRLSS